MPESTTSPIKDKKMDILNYKILQHYNPDVLAKEVNAELVQGAILIGYPYGVGSQHCQAVAYPKPKPSYIDREIHL